MLYTNDLTKIKPPVYKVYPKSIETEVVFLKTEMNSESKSNILQNTPRNIQHNYSTEFSSG